MTRRTLQTPRPPTEATATTALQRRLYFGVGKKFLGFQIADEEEQEDGSWKKLGKDGYRHWNVPSDDAARRRWRPVHEHLKGLHRGVVAIGSWHVPFVTVDFDRHEASVDPDEHIWRVLKAGRLLGKHFSELRWTAAEVNPRNGSMKFFGFGNEPIPIRVAQRFATEIHDLLLRSGCGATNKYGKQEVEVFPHNCVQVGLPMRIDKVTVVSSGILAKCNRRRQTQDRTYENYETYSALSFLQAIADRGCYDEPTLHRELKKACAALPFLPATTLSIPAVQENRVPPIQLEEVPVAFDVPNAKGDFHDEANSYKRQQDALLELCRSLRRVATVEEGLQFIRANGLFSGEWSENESRRQGRVAYLLERIAQTFDKTKCRGASDQINNDPLDISKINIGKYNQWVRAFVGRVTRTKRFVDEYGNVVERRGASADEQWVSAFLSVVEYCCVTHPNEDGSLPHEWAERIWLALQTSGRITVTWDDRKWKVARDFLERMGVIQIVDRKWQFRHGNGQAMKWAVGKGFDRLHIWWKRVRRPSGNPAVPLGVFLKSMQHTPSLNSYSHTEILKTAIQSPEAAPRGPPGAKA